MLRFRTACLLVGAMGAVGYSCALDGFNRVDTPPTVASAGGSGGAGGSTVTTGGTGGTGGSGCDRVTFPAQPAVQNAGGTIQFTVALRTLRLAEDANGGPVGVDLDGRCTCAEDGASCQPLPGGKEMCDTDGGRDSVLSQVLEPVGLLLGGSDLSSQYSNAANNGEWSLLLRVSGYNGEADDDRVRLDIYVTTGRGIDPPNWDGNDSWPVSEVSLVGGQGMGGMGGMGQGGTGGGPPLDLDNTVYFDDNAYVVGNQLVASIPGSNIVMAGGSSRVSLRVTGGGVRAEIVPSGSTYALRDGLLTGRIKIEDMFNMLSSFRDNSGDPLCTDNLFYGQGKKVICESMDLLAGSGPPTDTCSALSFATSFDADPAILGAIEAPGPITNPCPMAIDPALDTCPASL